MSRQAVSFVSLRQRCVRDLFVAGREIDRFSRSVASRTRRICRAIAQERFRHRRVRPSQPPDPATHAIREWNMSERTSGKARVVW
jgi:hypothetical protein